MTKNIVMVDTQTRFVGIANPLIGNMGEGNCTELVIIMTNFLNGNALLEISRPDPEDINKNITQYEQMKNEKNGYSLIIPSSVLQVAGDIRLCLHIYKSSLFESETFKSSVFEMTVGDTINAQTDEIQECPYTEVMSWME